VLKAENQPVLCVDIGGTSTKAGILDTSGVLHSADSIPTKPDDESYFGNLLRLIQQIRGNERSLTQLGVAVAGFLDSERDHLLYNSNLAWLEDFPLRRRLVEHFPDLAVELEVDSNAATMAEYQFGSGVNSKRFLCLTAGTGLGVGMAVNGVPLRFAYGCMGDIGHTIVLRNGPLCTCGGRGCAEVMISAPLVAERAQASSLREAIDAANQGNKTAIAALTQAGEWLGLAIASMANTFFPDHIAVAGGLSAAGDFVLKPAEQVFRESAGVLARSKVTFARAKLGVSATLIGAAWPFWKRETI